MSLPKRLRACCGWIHPQSFTTCNSTIRPLNSSRLKLVELLDGLASARKHTQDVESHLHEQMLATESASSKPSFTTMCTYSLAQRPALSHSHLVTLLHTERRADVRGQVGVSLLVAGVLGDEVEVFAADDDSAVHFCADDSAGEDTAADRDEAGEGAFLVCVVRMLVRFFIHFPFVLEQSSLPLLRHVCAPEPTYRCTSIRSRSSVS